MSNLINTIRALYMESVELDEIKNVDIKMDRAAAKLVADLKKKGKKPADIRKALEINFPSMVKTLRKAFGATSGMDDAALDVVGKKTGINMNTVRAVLESVELDEGAIRDKKSYKAGQKAAQLGKKYDTNPNPKGSQAHLDWSKGHNSARSAKIDRRNEEVNEAFTVHVDDGRDYGDEPHTADQKFFMDALKKYKGKVKGQTDKGVNVEFPNIRAQSNFVHAINKMSPKKTMHAEGLEDPKDNPCWKGYDPVGTKMKDGKKVPNCVPKEGLQIDEALEVKLRGGKVPVGQHRFKYDVDKSDKYIENSIKERDPKATVERKGKDLWVTASAGAHSSVITSMRRFRVNGTISEDTVTSVKDVKAPVATPNKSGTVNKVANHPGSVTAPVTIKKEKVNIKKFGSSQIKKAVALAKKMGGNMTGAVKAIEKMAKGLSQDVAVKNALRLANEDWKPAKNKKLKEFLNKGDKS